MVKIRKEDEALILDMYNCLKRANEETLEVLKSINKVLCEEEMDKQKLETARDNLYNANEKIAQMCGQMEEAWQNAD